MKSALRISTKQSAPALVANMAGRAFQISPFDDYGYFQGSVVLNVIVTVHLQ